MKKLIFLKQEYVEPKGLNKTKIKQAQQDIFQTSLTAFKQQMKGHAYHLRKEIPPDAVLIEYADALNDEMIDALRQADIVDIIDGVSSEASK
jgi:hypothetical protein